MAEHPITPPQWQVDAWCKQAFAMGADVDAVFLEAVRWGADQELEACLLEVGGGRRENLSQVIALRAARRPKPPSLKEQALEQLECIQTDLNKFGMGISTDTIRRALEALND